MMLFSILRVSLNPFFTHAIIALTVIFTASMSNKITSMAKDTKRRGRIHHAVVIVVIKLLLGLGLQPLSLFLLLGKIY